MRLKRKALNWAHDAFWGLPLPDSVKTRIHASFRRLSTGTRVHHASDSTRRVYSSHARATRSSAVRYFEMEGSFTPLPQDPQLIAYYLPQFHPTKENDEWWGPGVTEWNNVARALPQYDGHVQPRIPADLGYYDLRVDDVIRRQADMAREAGLSAWAVYFYWFGKDGRLLDMPLDKMASMSGLSVPFCLCWANESWTKRFDGVSSDILREQDHSEETYRAFLDVAEPYLLSGNYYRLNGDPVIVIYRPYKIPNLTAVLQHWRKVARERWQMNLHLIAVRDFSSPVDLIAAGFDAQSEFQPAQVFPFQEVVNKELDILNENFSGKVYSYEHTVRDKPYFKAIAPYFYRAVAAGWDNSPRRNDSGVILHGGSPRLYYQWLRDVIERGHQDNPGRNLIFINAWNEWGEGAYLEPDSLHAWGYLAATRQAILDARSVTAAAP